MPRSRANAEPCAHAVGMFDASTLGKIEVVGPDAAEFLNRIYTNPSTRLAPGRCRYGMMLSEDGFVIDDGVVARLGAGPLPRDHHDRRRRRACCTIWRTICRPNGPSCRSG